MNSSTGFKKRSLLRPPSGMLSNQREFLKCIDISQSEPIIASNIRSEVASIQQQINLLDNDKKIRTGEASLEKGYVLALKKWLHASQQMVQKEDEDSRILKHMGVDSYESGFKKIWKLFCHFDLIVSKMTELQIISFLKYDEMFYEFTEDSPVGAKILDKIAKTGFNPSNFYPSQLILDRNQEIFSAASKLRRQESSLSSSKGFTKQTRDQTNQLIQQLRNQNSKLVTLLEQMEQTSRNNDSKQPETIPNSPQSIFDSIQSKYKQQINHLNDKIHGLNHEIAQLRIHTESIQVKFKACEKEVQDLKGNGVPKQKFEPGSYEEALLEEMNKMKAGFQRKIERIVQQYSTRQRQMRKKEYEYKTENDRIKWEKGLLLKKFETLSA